MAWRGQLSRNLKELRIVLCPNSPSSINARTFVERNYKDLKTLNPKLPILIRECRGVNLPEIWVRYDGGFQSGIALHEHMTESLILKELKNLARCN